MDTLKSMVTFTSVASGDQATSAHNITVYGVAYAPDEVTPNLATFEVVSADSTTITVRKRRTDDVLVHGPL